MKIEDFKNEAHVEPVILHTDNGKKGNKNRRMTIAATVIQRDTRFADNKLVIARSTCGEEDQFRRDIGVSKSLGRLLSIVTKLKSNSVEEFGRLENTLKRFGTQVDIIAWPHEFNRKEILQTIDLIK